MSNFSPLTVSHQCNKQRGIMFTRLAIKLLVIIFIIVGVTTPQVKIDYEEVTSVSLTLTTVTISSPWETTSFSIKSFLKNVGATQTCMDNFSTMYNTVLTTAILAILLAATGVCMVLINTFRDEQLPDDAFIAVCVVETITSVAAFAISASVAHGSACNVVNMNDQEGVEYGAGFTMLVVGWFVALCDLAVEIIIMTGVIKVDHCNNGIKTAPTLSNINNNTPSGANDIAASKKTTTTSSSNFERHNTAIVIDIGSSNVNLGDYQRMDDK